MKRRNAEVLGNLVRQLLREEGLETPYNEYRLIKSWKDVVGDVIDKYTGGMRIYNQTLHVDVKSSVMRQELYMMRSQLVKRLNERVGAQVITDIQFH